MINMLSMFNMNSLFFIMIMFGGGLRALRACCSKVNEVLWPRSLVRTSRRRKLLLLLLKQLIKEFFELLLTKSQGQTQNHEAYRREEIEFDSKHQKYRCMTNHHKSIEETIHGSIYVLMCPFNAIYGLLAWSTIWRCSRQLFFGLQHKP